MNRRLLTIFLPLAATVILFQWWQRTQILTSESDLRAELAQLKVLRAQAPTSSASPAAASERTAPPAAVAFDPDKFVSDLSGLAPLINNKTGDGNPADIDVLQQQALSIMGRIATAPPALLKQAYEKLMGSSLPDQMKGELSQPMLLRLAETEPAWAVSQGAKIANNDFVLHNLLKIWAATDASAAKAWVETAANDGSLAGFGGGVVERLNSGIAAAQASTDPTAVLNDLPGLSPEVQRQAVTSMAPALKTREARRAAMERIGQGDQVTLQHFARALGENAGFEASREVLDSAKLTPQMHDAAAGIIAASGIGPETASRANWLIKNRRTTDTEPLKNLIQTWTRADFNSAATWLRDLPSGASRDTAVATFAPLVAEKEPPSAVDWAVTITDPEQRSATLKQVWTNWKAQSPEEATGYFQQKGLPLPE